MNDTDPQWLVNMLKIIDARFTAIEQRLTALEQRQQPERYQQTHPHPGWGADEPMPQPWVVACDSRNSGGLNG